MKMLVYALPYTTIGKVNKMVRMKQPQWMWLLMPLSLLFFLFAWDMLGLWGQYDSFILPRPMHVWQQFYLVLADGRLVKHTWVTFGELMPGLLIGCLVAMPLGYLLAKLSWAERLLSPYLIASQAIPVIAIAPLLTIWIHSVYWSRVTVAVLVVFFPILVNVVTGLRNVPAEFYDLFRSLQATRWQIFRHLELPAALPMILSGLKVGATLSVIGTLVGEFVQPKSQGLGFLLVTARYQFKTDLVFVVLITLAAITLTMYGVVTLLEKRWLRWQVN